MHNERKQKTTEEKKNKNQSNFFFCTGSFGLEVVFKLDYKIRNMCEIERTERIYTLICADFISIALHQPKRKFFEHFQKKKYGKEKPIQTKPN